MSQVAAILRKDLLIEWRFRARGFSLACFAVTLLLLFSFAIGPDSAVLRAHTAAYVWMAVLLSSSLLLSRSMVIETESGAIDALLLVPVSPAALFYGKALATTGQLVLLCAVALPAALIIGDGAVAGSPWLLAAILILGSAGLAAPGTLYAALTARIPAQQLLLPLLLFPLVVPALLAAVKATSLVLLGDPMNQVPSWMALLVCFDLVYWSLSGVLFRRVLEG